jgi:hypothetical protein
VETGRVRSADTLEAAARWRRFWMLDLGTGRRERRGMAETGGFAAVGGRREASSMAVLRGFQVEVQGGARRGRTCGRGRVGVPFRSERAGLLDWTGKRSKYSSSARMGRRANVVV